MKEVQVDLISETLNFVACASNTIDVFHEGGNEVTDSSFKVEWNGGASGGEKLSVLLNSEEAAPFDEFFVRVYLCDPGIVQSDEATNLARKILLKPVYR